MTGFKIKMYGLKTHIFTLLSDNTVAVWGKLTKQSSWGIHLYDMQGKLHSTKELSCDCGDNYHDHLEVTLNSHRYLAISCRERREIWLYSFTTQRYRLVYSAPGKRGPEPRHMCHGPNNTILAVDATDGSSSVAEFHFTYENNLTLSRLTPVQSYECNDIYSVCCAETTRGPLLFITNFEEHAIRATHLQSSHTQWQVQGQVDGEECYPHGLCHGAGRLYVADGPNARILVLDAATGAFIQSIVPPQTWRVWNVAWSEQQPHLVALQNIYKDYNDDEKEARGISYFNICVPDKTHNYGLSEVIT